jgi:hypothetical protein
MDQVTLLYEKAIANSLKEMMELAFAVRVGVNANKQEWKKFLDGTHMKQPKKVKDKMTKADVSYLERILKNGR